ncbi:cyclophilin [Mycobacterium sp. E802]|nr:cyclophilin [Mycobacterium sp. E802]
MTVLPPYGGYPPPARTNGMAVAALVCACVFAPLGIVFGHISLSQLNRSGEQGRGLAIAGLIIGYVMTALSILLVGVLVMLAVFIARTAEGVSTQDRRTTSAASDLPPFAPPQNLGANCQYPPTTEPATTPVKPPRTGAVPTDPANVEAGIVSNRGSIGLTLANGKAPCTVNNFASLAAQGFFDGTRCHRLTTGDLAALHCGDPSGNGTGGPGYRFPNEYPTNQYRLSDPALRRPVIYPRGTVAMANSGAGTNGSQFFLVYQDSWLPPTYTVFGTVDTTGLATLDKIAAAGVAGGGTDGRPAMETELLSVSAD